MPHSVQEPLWVHCLARLSVTKPTWHAKTWMAVSFLGRADSGRAPGPPQFLVRPWTQVLWLTVRTLPRAVAHCNTALRTVGIAVRVRWYRCDVTALGHPWVRRPACQNSGEEIQANGHANRPEAAVHFKQGAAREPFRRRARGRTGKPLAPRVPSRKKTIRTAARLAPIRTTIRSRVALNACHQRETPDQRRPPGHGHVSVQKRSEAASLRLPGEPLLSVPPPLHPVTSSCLEQIPMRNADESYRLEMPVRKANERLLPHDIRDATSWPLVRPISLAADTSSFFVPPRLSVCPKPAR